MSCDPTAPFPTPTVRLERLLGTRVDVWAKLENLQLTGSTKERTAASLLADAFADGRLAAGGTVVESTSGNLGVALARRCALADVRLVAVVDRHANRLALRHMAAYGAHVEVVDAPDDGTLLAARRARVAELLATIPGAVTTDQYGSPANPRAHAAGTMPELLAALDDRLDVLYVATSTTGTLLGCQQHLRARGLATRVVAVDSEGSALFGGAPGARHLPGMGAGTVPELARSARPDAVVRVAEVDSVRGCRRLARTEGILAGASTGALVAALTRDVPAMADGTRVAFLVHDSGVPYLDTVYDDAWVAATLGIDVAELDGQLTEASGVVRTELVADARPPAPTL